MNKTEKKIIEVLKDDIEKLSYFNDLRNYQKGFNILMEYFDDLNDADKPTIDKQLKRLGL